MDARLRVRSARLCGRGPLLLVGAVWLAAAGVLAGCSKPAPRTFRDFMRDQISRDAVLARCDRDGAASARDLECANARRAALTIELRHEQARQARYHKQSEEKIAALRARIAVREQVERVNAAAAKTTAERAYEARWNGQDAGPAPGGGSAVDGGSAAASSAAEGGSQPSAAPEPPAAAPAPVAAPPAQAPPTP